MTLLLCICAEILLSHETGDGVWQRVVLVSFVVAIMTFLNKIESWHTDIEFHSIF